MYSEKNNAFSIEGWPFLTWQNFSRTWSIFSRLIVGKVHDNVVSSVVGLSDPAAIVCTISWYICAQIVFEIEHPACSTYYLHIIANIDTVIHRNLANVAFFVKYRKKS